MKVECLECGRKFSTKSMLTTCPKCGGSDVDLVEPPVKIKEDVMPRTFWKLLTLQQVKHLRVDSNVYTEAAFWRTRKAQRAWDAEGGMIACFDCRIIEQQVNRARAS